MTITAAESTDLFTGSGDNPLQVVRVTVSTPGRLRVEGDRLFTPQPVEVSGEGAEAVVEVAVDVDAKKGEEISAEAVLESQSGQVARHAFTFVVEEPGWTVFMIPHFHYDPVWWNTQAAYTETWVEGAWQLGVRLPIARVPFGRGPPRCRPARPRLRLRSCRARLPQALLGCPSRGSRLHRTVARRSAGAGWRHLQRAQHQPHRIRDHDPEPGLRGRVPARRAGRRTGHGLAARRLRA